MSDLGPVVVAGTLLSSHLVWLQSNAGTNKKGKLCCTKCGDAISSCVHHRFRMKSDDPNALYASDAQLPNKTGEVEHYAFNGYACATCKEYPEVPDSITAYQLVFFRA